MNTPIVPLDGEGDQTILFEICPEINKTVSKKKNSRNTRVLESPYHRGCCGINCL